MSLEDDLVLDGSTAAAGSGDDNVGTSRQKTLENFHADWTLPDTSQQGVLILERGTRSRDLVEDVEVNPCEVATVLPVCPRLALETEGPLGTWGRRD